MFCTFGIHLNRRPQFEYFCKISHLGLGLEPIEATLSDNCNQRTLTESDVLALQKTEDELGCSK